VPAHPRAFLCRTRPANTRLLVDWMLVSGQARRQGPGPAGWPLAQIRAVCAPIMLQMRRHSGSGKELPTATETNVAAKFLDVATFLQWKSRSRRGHSVRAPTFRPCSYPEQVIYPLLIHTQSKLSAATNTRVDSNPHPFRGKGLRGREVSHKPRSYTRRPSYHILLILRHPRKP
jgi:hypothetical protein